MFDISSTVYYPSHHVMAASLKMHNFEHESKGLTGHLRNKKNRLVIPPDRLRMGNSVLYSFWRKIKGKLFVNLITIW